LLELDPGPCDAVYAAALLFYVIYKSDPEPASREALRNANYTRLKPQVLHIYVLVELDSPHFGHFHVSPKSSPNLRKLGLVKLT